MSSINVEERLAVIRNIEIEKASEDTAHVFRAVAAEGESASVADGSAVSFVGNLQGQMRASLQLLL